MSKPPSPVAEFIVDQLRDWAPVTARRLFGGWGIYNGPVMLGLVSRDTIYFRVDESNRPDYEAATAKAFVHAARKRAGVEAGPQPFRYARPNGKTIEMAYYEVPADVLESPDELAQWAAKAHAAALKVARNKLAKKKNAPAKKPRAKAKKR